MNKVHYSTGKDDWETPDELFATYDHLFNFILDAAANESNHKVDAWWGPGSPLCEDALLADWSTWLERGNIWLNPPYSRELQSKFVETAWNAVAQSSRDYSVVCLLPARTDTRLYHDVCARHGEVTFLRGRLKFKGAAHGAPFPSMIVRF